MDKKQKIEKIKLFIKDIISDDFDLIDIFLKGSGSNTVLTVLIDKNTGGISIGECVGINRKLCIKMDEEGLFEHKYSIDVSSPGIDYPLKTLKDFKRNINKKVKFNVENQMDDEVEGIIEQAQGNFISVVLKDGRKIKLKIEDIKKAKQLV